MTGVTMTDGASLSFVACGLQTAPTKRRRIAYATTRHVSSTSRSFSSSLQPPFAEVISPQPVHTLPSKHAHEKGSALGPAATSASAGGCRNLEPEWHA
jgi:hypothetical protein